MGTLTGKVALITGASSGIGRATALGAAREGASIVVADMNAEGGHETVNLVKEAGAEALFVQTNVTDAASVDALMSETLARFGTLDLAFNNAGIAGALGETHAYDKDAWDTVIAVNLTGVFICLKAELAVMRERGSGAVVNTASILGLVGFANTPAYTAAKHGVVGLTQVAALENAGHGIRVNAVCPGFIETPMVMDGALKARENPEVIEQIESSTPAGRLGQPEEIAEAVLWLWSDRASYMNGHALAVDGAYTAQ
ncbi:MAG: SDR family NAD(P)-dependent oxidoreductase [Actinomycetota bacterium]